MDKLNRIFLFFCVALSSAEASLDYTYTHLSFMPTAISENGDVTGSKIYFNAALQLNVERAVKFSGGVLTDLGVLCSGANCGSSSYGLDINSSGSVVGYSSTGQGTIVHGFLNSGGVTVDLGADCPESSCSGNSLALSINDSGQILGVSSGYVYINQLYLGAQFSAGCCSSGQIANSGHAAFTARNANGGTTGFFYQGNSLSSLAVGNLSTEARSINGSDQVVGSVNGHAALWSGGTWTELLSGAPFASTAYGINDSGQIVGMAHNGVQHRAVIFANGSVVDLNQFCFVCATSGQLLSYATGVNNAGMIVGYHSGGNSGFLLTPTATPEPQSIFFVACGLFGVVALRRKRG
jgi:probable HAF family extracellular repeat protein